MQSQQKGKIEVAHEYIRRYIPKGTSFNNITQEKLTLICNHINSVPREKMLDMNAFKVQKCFCPEIFFQKIRVLRNRTHRNNLKILFNRIDTT